MRQPGTGVRHARRDQPRPRPQESAMTDATQLSRTGTRHVPAHAAPPVSLTARATAWLGWVLFVSIVMLAAGVINIIQGVVALVEPDFYPASAPGLPVDGSYTAWGIALLILGATLIAGAYG